MKYFTNDIINKRFKTKQNYPKKLLSFLRKSSNIKTASIRNNIISGLIAKTLMNLKTILHDCSC